MARGSSPPLGSTLGPGSDVACTRAWRGRACLVSDRIEYSLSVVGLADSRDKESANDGVKNGESATEKRRERHRKTARAPPKNGENDYDLRMEHLVTRHAAVAVEEALADTRIVVIQGARQVGKSTLARRVAQSRNSRMVTLDDNDQRVQAEADPVAFVEQHLHGLLVIDEVQRVPRLALALKLVVDRDPRPGRFLLTGSANLNRLPATEDSLAGRAEDVELHGFSQGELAGSRERFIDRLLAGEDFTGYTSSLTRADYLVLAEAGSYPEALAREPGKRRRQWLSNYAARIATRDAEEISGLQRLSELPTLLRLLAARTATELNVTSVASELGMPRRTLDPYLDLLETLFLIQRIPAWHNKTSRRLVSRPKIALLDTGLAARLAGVTAGPGAFTGIRIGLAAGSRTTGAGSDRARRCGRVVPPHPMVRAPQSPTPTGRSSSAVP